MINTYHLGLNLIIQYKKHQQHGFNWIIASYLLVSSSQSTFTFFHLDTTFLNLKQALLFGAFLATIAAHFAQLAALSVRELLSSDGTQHLTRWCSPRMAFWKLQQYVLTFWGSVHNTTVAVLWRWCTSV